MAGMVANGNKKLVAQCHKGEVIEDEDTFQTEFCD